MCTREMPLLLLSRLICVCWESAQCCCVLRFRWMFVCFPPPRSCLLKHNQALLPICPRVVRVLFFPLWGNFPACPAPPFSMYCSYATFSPCHMAMCNVTRSTRLSVLPRNGKKEHSRWGLPTSARLFESWPTVHDLRRMAGAADASTVRPQCTYTCSQHTAEALGCSALALQRHSLQQPTSGLAPLVPPKPACRVSPNLWLG